MKEARKPRTVLTLARSTFGPPLDVPRLDQEDDWHYAKRSAAIRALGPRWVAHPLYEFSPRHSVHSDVWRPARAAFLAQIASAAAAARARNPAYVRAQAVLDALGRQQ